MKLLATWLAILPLTVSATPLTTILKNPDRVQLEVDLDMTVATTGPVDILFVVDDSGSMTSHQNRLSQNIPTLVEALLQTGVDFHAGVTTTSPSKNVGHLRNGFVTPSTPEPRAQLAANLLVGTNGDATEAVFTPVHAALSEPVKSGPNLGFYREDAALALVVISDAEDQSVNFDPIQFVDWIKALKPQGQGITMQALLVNNTSTGCMSDGGKPLRTVEAVQKLGGDVHELCAPDMTSTISKVTQSIQALAADSSGEPRRPRDPLTSVSLSIAPKFETIRVIYGTQELRKGDVVGGWVYDAQKGEILFGSEIEWSMQPKDTPLTISYEPLH